MKLRRRLLAFVLSATMIFSSATVAYAAYSAKYNSTTVYSKKYNMSLYGYIDILEGNFWYEDLYLYRGVLSGSAVYKFPSKNDNIYIKVYDDEGDVAKTVKLYNGLRSVSDSEYYGRNSEYGELKIKCYDNSTTIKAYID